MSPAPCLTVVIPRVSTGCSRRYPDSCARR
jgi:hypothetical protein